MTLAQLIPLVISVSMGLIVFALGLHTSVREATFLLRRRGLLGRSILSMNVVMPVFAVALVAAFFDHLHPAIKIALLALAVSPVPPILPKKEAEAGGTPSYVVALLVVAAILAIVLAPVAVDLLGRIFGFAVHVPASRIASVVLITVIVPLFLGLIFRRVASEFAARIARPVSLFATVLLVVAFLPVLFQIWPSLVAMVGNGTLAVLALFALVGLAVGHLLGGPRHDDRTVLALATSTRHPGVALAIASVTFPDETAVLPILLLHLVVGTIVSLPYVSWRRRTTRRRLGRAESMMEGKENDIESRG